MYQPPFCKYLNTIRLLVFTLLVFFCFTTKAQYDCSIAGYKPMYMILDRNDTLVNGDTIIMDIYLGSSTQSLSNINIINFEISYNDSLSNGANIFYRRDVGSWFNLDDSISATKSDTISGLTSLYLYRVTPKSGFGSIGSLIIVIDDHLDGIIDYNTGLTYRFGFNFTSSTRAIDNGSNLIPLCFTNDEYYYKSYGVGIKEPVDLKLEIFPNPVHDYFEIISSENIDSYELYDIAGHQIFSKKVIGQTFNIQQNIQHIAKGMYLLKVLTKDSNWITKKLLIE